MSIKAQPRGFWHIAALNMAEFFSYYGMRSLLILFFTQYLLFSDKHAYMLYGSYTALVWVTPIIGGYLADRLLGYYFSVVLGVSMIFLGNVILALSNDYHALIYFSMAIIICGYGFFKG
ncbi:MAG: MFS transporter, partial [Endozoicomonadaceae bacterium]|nr:MFS transporter [Endozoicomonadaceae bacterium]